jgi:hypothetical protein
MKLAILLLLCISYTMSTKFCLGLCWQQNVLTNGATIAFESVLMNNLFIGANQSGPLFGVHIPMTGGTINSIIPTHKNVQWLVQQSGDFYCFRHVLSNDYLNLTGSRCMNLNSNQACGTASLSNATSCSRNLGFKIAMYQNWYILQHAQNPNLYLFFNNTGCVSGSTHCGSIVGYFFKSIEDIRTNNIYRGAYFNIPYQVRP